MDGRKLSELDRTFVQSPDEGTDSYYQKLEQQMSSGTPESRQLMAELHWVVDFHAELSRVGT